MIPYKLEDQSFNLPESWQEVTLAQWLAIRKADAGDICAVLEIFTGISRERWFNTREIDVVEKLLPNLQFISETTDLDSYFKSFPVPEQIVIEEEIFPIPKDIKLETYGQKITMQNLLPPYISSECISIEFAPIALSIYLYNKKPFTDVGALALADKMKSLPVTIAIPVATFFLTNFLQSFNPNTTLWVQSTKENSWRQESKS